VDRRRLVYAPRAQRELLALGEADALRILSDLLILEAPPWPGAKVKRLYGFGLWEIRTGDFRTVFLPEGKDVVIVRVVNRRDLEREVGRINETRLRAWLRSRR